VANAAAAEPGEETYQEDGGLVVIPPSSVQRPQDAGIRAHTNMRLFFPDGVRAPKNKPKGKYETPGSLACVYGLVAATPGCNPATATTPVTGGSKVIAIVDAYDDPTAANDLGIYSRQFGLPAITDNNFQVVYATGTKPQQDVHGLWELEENLDIELAHAMAPGASLILVEAASSNAQDLYAAVQVAANLVAAEGGGEVSCSWGVSETKNEEQREALFTGTNVVFVAATGDSAGTNQPSVLQNVVATGGTSIKRDDMGNFVQQSAWKATGGGPSTYVTIPSYQAPVANIVGSTRGVPDLAFDAKPSSGAWIYDTTPYFGQVYKWTPAIAGLLNSAGEFAASSPAELTQIYDGFTNKTDWTDIRLGKCGAGAEFKSRRGWDFCTGVGVPYGYGGK
jgi:kumamolisin